MQLYIEKLISCIPGKNLQNKGCRLVHFRGLFPLRAAFLAPFSISTDHHTVIFININIYNIYKFIKKKKKKKKKKKEMCC